MSSGASATGNPRAQSFSFAQLTRQLRGSPLVALLIVGAAVIAVVIALLLWARSPDYRVLYSNLSEADGGNIIAELDNRNIPYRFSQGGQALLVPADQVHPLRLQLAAQGLPEGGNVGLELMEDQAFGISQFAEQVNYQRGLEGELASSMESLGPVAGARVHLALAKDSVFVRRQEPAKASVVLTLHPGRTLGEGQVSAITHMVSSSVPDLSIEAVTVVDQGGRLLSTPDGNGLGLDGSQLDYVAEVERAYRRRIEAILVPILGRDNVQAQVTAQLDFAKREETSERFGPNQPPNEAAVRSHQTSLDLNGAGDLADGIPGALSNTPPGAAPSPIQDEPAGEGEDEDGQGQAGEEDGGGATDQRLSRNDVVNYEVDRQVSHVQQQRGQVERLSAAVVVDYRERRDEQTGELVPAPLDDEEMAQIERLIHQALGFSAARGDQVAVVNSPFAEDDVQASEPAWWQRSEVQQLAFALGRYLLVGLALLLLYLLILRPFIRRYTEQPLPASAPPAPSLQARVGDEHDEADAEPRAEGEAGDGEAAPRRRKRRATAYEQNLNDLREMAQEDPRMVAMIVRGWMSKHDE